jgi:hypothetical protein
MHSETANRRRDMEMHIDNAKLSLRELETVTGGKQVEMRGDTWEANGDGAPKQTTHRWAIFSDLHDYFFGK